MERIPENDCLDETQIPGKYFDLRSNFCQSHQDDHFQGLFSKNRRIKIIQTSVSQCFTQNFYLVSVASCSGEMLRECVAIDEELAKIIIYDQRFYALFEYVNLDAFDVASDAFRTFRVSPRTQILISLDIRGQTSPRRRLTNNYKDIVYKDIFRK